MPDQIKKPRGYKSVMIIAGEASGDLHGAKVVHAMKERASDLYFFGIGGRELRASGVDIVIDASELAVVGITEIFSKTSSLLRGMSTAKRLIKTVKPDLLILIDYPDFNLHVAATARKCGVPVLYYISPQIWAWRSGRVKKIRDRVDHMAVILPFEAEFYKRHGVPVTFVGHPLLDKASGITGAISTSLIEGPPVIGFLPGSRDLEVARLLPEMVASIPILKRRFPGIRFVVSLAPSVERSLMDSILAAHYPERDIEIEERGAQAVLAKSTLVVAASGTVTLETAISGTPMVIVYKVSPISYLLGRMLIRVESIGLANLIAGKKVCPELIQHQVSGPGIAETVAGMIQDPIGMAERRSELLKVKTRLGEAGASSRVAGIALTLIGRSGVAP